MLRSFREFHELDEALDLFEGVNDPSIFKAVFMAGGPGSGKGFIGKQLGLSSFGFRPVNSDIAFEFIAKKRNFSLKMSEKDMEKIQKLRARGKDLTQKQMDLAISGRLGLLIDGTGKDADKIKEVKDQLEDIGYETMMVFVNTSLETALERNEKRARSVPESVVKDSWEQVQNNIGKFQSMFGSNRFVVVDNNDDSPDVSSAYRQVMKFATSEPRSREAKKWIEANS